VTQCKKHHLFFIPLKNGLHKAMDTYCGHTVDGQTWYCSKECLRLHREGQPLKYIQSNDELIMNDRK